MRSTAFSVKLRVNDGRFCWKPYLSPKPPFNIGTIAFGWLWFRINIDWWTRP